MELTLDLKKQYTYADCITYMIRKKNMFVTLRNTEMELRFAESKNSAFLRDFS